MYFCETSGPWVYVDGTWKFTQHCVLRGQQLLPHSYTHTAELLGNGGPTQYWAV